MRPLLRSDITAGLLVGSILIFGVMISITEMLSFGWRYSALVVFFMGHFATSYGVLHKRVRLEWPPDGQWVDVVVVTIACWLGPIVWLYHWNRLHRR